jgi:hemoglobin
VKTLVLLSIVLFAGCIGTGKERSNPAKAEDPKSIYFRLGGQPAVDAAVELFYKKVLADKSVNHHFEGINLDKQRAKQKQFLAAAFGGPVPYTGKDLRKAHRNLDLKESDFNAIAGHLQATLKELKIPDKLIAEVMAVAASTKDDVLDN